MDNTEVVTLIYQELLKVAGGIALVLGALSAFLGKLWISRIANQEAQRREAAITELKAQLEIGVQRTVLVDKMQFEHEYDIYRKAWERLFALQQATLQLRPTFDYVDPTESKEDLMRKRIGNVREPYNNFSTLVETNKPFYPEKVYVALVAVRNKCREEVDDCEFTDRSRKEYWSEARKNQEEIVALINNCCEVIRGRIAEVRVA